MNKTKMPTIVIIEKDATLKEHTIKDAKFNEPTLYRKIGLKTANNFERIYDDGSGLLLFGKKTGKSNCINTYTFDSIVESLKGCVLFGSCIVLKLADEETLCNFTLADFAKLSEPSTTTPFYENVTTSSIEPTKKMVAKKRTTKSVVTTDEIIVAVMTAPPITTIQPDINDDEELKEEDYI